MAAQAACSQTKHRLASSQGGARPGGCDHAGTVAAGRARVARVHAQHVEHVPAEMKSGQARSDQVNTVEKRHQAGQVPHPAAHLKLMPTALTSNITWPGPTAALESMDTGARFCSAPRGWGSSWKGAGVLRAALGCMSGR